MYQRKGIKDAVKDVDVKKRVVTGYLSAFGNKDYGGDIIVKGAFAKTLKDRKGKIYFLNQHNWDQPHGRFAVLQEDAKGLYFESEPLIDTTYSSDLLKLYEAGIVGEHSIGYETIRASNDHEKDARMLQELKLYEGSNVTMGMNPETPFLGFKAGFKQAADQAKRILKMLRSGDVTDDTMNLLEIALKNYEYELIELGKNIAAAPDEKSTQPEPSGDTQVIDILSEFNKSFKN